MWLEKKRGIRALRTQDSPLGSVGSARHMEEEVRPGYDWSRRGKGVWHEKRSLTLNRWVDRKRYGEQGCHPVTEWRDWHPHCRAKSKYGGIPARGTCESTE